MPVGAPKSKKGKVKKNAGVVAVDHDHPPIFSWQDERLKDSAMKIPSQVDMPYVDLLPQFRGNIPVPDAAQPCDVWEIYSVPRLGPVMRSMGGLSRRAYDLRNFWDFSQEDYRRLLIQDVTMLRPKYLMLCPPCRFVCLLMASNWGRMKNYDEKMLSLTDALGHIDLSMWLAWFQILQGNFFAFEHPPGSLAWGRDSVPQLIQNDSNIFLNTFDKRIA